jgi:hypothetical protein
MPAGRKPSRDGERRAKLLGFCEALPEIDVSGEQHLAFRVRKRTFAYYLNDHHGDGIVSICCKADGVQQQDLVARAPERYYVPAYLGARGWVALRLDLPEVDWGEVVRLLFNAYRMQAPRRLAEQV